MSNETVPAGGLATGTWRLDQARSSVEFHVRHFYGPMTVKGRFDRYQGSPDLSVPPAVELVFDAESLDTNQKQRDKHLRSDDFFDATVAPVDGEFEIEATALADHRELGMTWSPMGILRAPSKPIIRGRVGRAEDAR